MSHAKERFLKLEYFCAILTLGTNLAITQVVKKGLTSVLRFPLFHHEQCVYFRLLAFIFRRSLPTRLFLPPIFLPPFRPPPFLWYSETSFALLFVLALLPFFLPPKPNLLSLKFLLLLSLKFFLKLSGLLQKEMQNM